MKTTNNYNLLKPEKTDYYNIEDQNNNMNMIDEVLSNKVQKIDGKGLSTEDYTTSEKNKLAKIYDWAMEKFALIGHNHDTNYSNISHNHNAEYLLKSEKAIDSDKLDGKNSTDFADSNHNHDSRYEQIISKNSGFNLDKSDSVSSSSTSVLATVKAVKIAYDKAVQALNTANGKLSANDTAINSNKYKNREDIFHPENYGFIGSRYSSGPLTVNNTNQVIITQNTSDITMTVPASGIPNSAQITVLRGTNSRVTFVPASGVTIRSMDNKRSIKGLYGSATLIKISNTEWYLIGSLE